MRCISSVTPYNNSVYINNGLRPIEEGFSREGRPQIPFQKGI